VENRIELKAVLRSTDINILEGWIIRQTSLRKLFDSRNISNLYFDTPEYISVSDNIDGISKRTKIRYRWYGDGGLGCVSSGNLEFKRKHNNEGWKEQFGVELTGESVKTYREILAFIQKNIPLDKQIEFSKYNLPTVLNNYNRKYYITMDSKIRVTVDTSITAYDQRWSDKVSAARRIIMPDVVIVEFKFSPGDKNLLVELINNFPFRVSKNSKYISSMLHLK